MMRVTAVGVLGLMGLTSALGQSVSTAGQLQNKDRRLDEALTDLALLKRLIREQDRRIAALEKALRAQPVPSAVEGPALVPERAKIPPKILVPWHNPQTWATVREGMSRAQVEDILGKPTSVDAVIDSQTLNYKGETSGGGVLTGSVQLTDDRVKAVSPPDF